MSEKKKRIHDIEGWCGVELGCGSATVWRCGAFRICTGGGAGDADQRPDEWPYRA